MSGKREEGSGDGDAVHVEAVVLHEKIELRQLQSVDEVEAWTQLCEDGFSTKGSGTPREYFLRHFRDDPWAAVKGVFVAQVVEARRDADDKGACARNHFVACVRVFHRAVYAGDGSDTTWTMGGIGEVCTLPSYRGRGIATRLLDMCKEYMTKAGMLFSSLHGAAAARKLYERGGWRSAALAYGAVKGDMRSRRAGELQNQITIQAWKVPATGGAGVGEDWLRLASTWYAAQARHIPGAMVRSETYYRTWMASACAMGRVHYYWVLKSGDIAASDTTIPSTTPSTDLDDTTTPSPIALVGLKRYNDVITVADFVFDASALATGEGRRDVLFAAAQASTPILDPESTAASAALLAPLTALRHWEVPCEPRPDLSDEAWMLQSLERDAGAPTKWVNAQVGGAGGYVFWLADNF